MSQIVSEALIERLADWGAATVSGIPGDGIDRILAELRRRPAQLQAAGCSDSKINACLDKSSYSHMINNNGILIRR